MQVPHRMRRGPLARDRGHTEPVGRSTRDAPRARKRKLEYHPVRVVANAIRPRAGMGLEADFGGGADVILLPRLDNGRPILIQQPLRSHGGAYDGDVAGRVGIGALVNDHHEVPLIGEGLSLLRAADGAPTRLAAWLGMEPLGLSVG